MTILKLSTNISFWVKSPFFALKALDKKYFVRADERGIRPRTWNSKFFDFVTQGLGGLAKYEKVVLS